MFVEELRVFPLTGARGQLLPHARVTPDGLENDRKWVVYDQITGCRISTKPDQAPQLHRIQVLSVFDGLIDFRDESGESTGDVFQLPAEPFGRVTVTEFGDQTPAYDLGNEAALKFSDFLHRSVRVARKITGAMDVMPLDRAVAPVHVTTTKSQGFVSEQSNVDLQEIGQRFRSNVVINNDEGELFEELGWSRIKLGSVVLDLHRPTLRCPVPSQNPFTGKNMKDIARVYPELPKGLDNSGRLKTIFGVYGVLSNDELGLIRLNEKAEVIND